jgi:hypothetical protein
MRVREVLKARSIPLGPRAAKIISSATKDDRGCYEGSWSMRLNCGEDNGVRLAGRTLQETARIARTVGVLTISRDF